MPPVFEWSLRLETHGFQTCCRDIWGIEVNPESATALAKCDTHIQQGTDLALDGSRRFHIFRWNHDRYL